MRDQQTGASTGAPIPHGAVQWRYADFGESKDRTLRGTLVSYGKDYRLSGSTWERFEPRCFGQSTLGGFNLTLQHDRTRPLARNRNGFQLEDSPERLTINVELPETREADDVLELIAREVYSGFSVEFLPIASERRGQTIVRSEASLTGCSIVDRPQLSDAVFKRAQANGTRRNLPLWRL